MNGEAQIKNIEALEKIVAYLQSQCNQNGALVCPQHKFEHLGRTAYFVGLLEAMYRQTGKSFYKEDYLRQIRRLLQNDAKSVATKAAARWNQSSNIIDTASIVDQFVIALTRHRDNFSEEEVSKLDNFVKERCENYLQVASVDKLHLNQRLLGAVGLAQGYSLFKVPAWKEAVILSINKSLDEVYSDGSAPYIFDYKTKKLPAAAADVSVVYQSRLIAYTIYALEQVGENNEKKIRRLISATNFLRDTYTGLGYKSLALESKRWYYRSEYEVASNVFDVYALMKMYSYTKDSSYLRVARESFEVLLSHTKEGLGLLDNKGNENNFLCSIFVNTHALWMARALDQKTDLMTVTDEVEEDSVIFYKDAGLLSITSHNQKILIRGSASPITKQWGGVARGGAVVSWVDKNTSRQLISGVMNNAMTPGAVSLSSWRNPIDFSSDHPLTMATYRMKLYNSLRARQFRNIFYLLKEIIRPYLSLKEIYSNQWAASCQTEIISSNHYKFTSSPTSKSGRVISEIVINREVEILAEQVMITDSIVSTSNDEIVYSTHPNIVIRDVNSKVPPLDKGTALHFPPQKEIVVSFCLSV